MLLGGIRLAEVLAFGAVTAYTTRAWMRRASNATGSPLGSVQGVTDETAAQELLFHQALHDPLTDLPNRALFLDRLEQAIALRRRRASGARPAVLFIDLDRFKAVNDAYGHSAGDHLLVATAGRLRQLVRQGDTVARIGGDEFVILVEDAFDDDHAMALAGRIGVSLAEPVSVEGSIVHVTASIGIAVAEDGSDAQALLRDADLAMYRAKDQGRARTEVFDSRLRRDVLRRIQTERELRKGILEDELVLHFQPCVSIAHGDVVAVEALARWQHPEKGLLQPCDFIPVAEESGLVVQLGSWVFREACRAGARLHEKLGPLTPTVWVNVSAHQLKGGLATMIAEVLDESGFPAARLGIELTESALMDDADSAATELEKVRALGVHIALDDFGTGFSSLSYLRRFPFDLLKIDRSFVSGVGVDAEDTAIVTACVALAHSLGMPCVAEGVERSSQLHALRLLGCDLIQGFLFSRPVAEEELHVVIESLVLRPLDTTTAERVRVLVCDDEPSVRLLLRVGLEAEGAEVVEVADAEACLFSASVTLPDLVLLDLKMPGHNGMWALEKLHESMPTLPVMLVTAAIDPEMAARAHDLGARACMDKVGILDHLGEMLDTIRADSTAA